MGYIMTPVKRVEVGTGFGAGLKADFLGKKVAGRSNAMEKENLRRKKAAEISPYETVARAIDSALVQLDKVKLKIESSNKINFPLLQASLYHA